MGFVHELKPAHLNLQCFHSCLITYRWTVL